LRDRLREVTGLDLPVDEWAKEEGIADEEIRERVLKAANERYEGKRAKYSPDIMVQVEKAVVLQTLDHLWREHLVMLDHLRQVVGLRGYGQRDPLNEYKTEGFNLFEHMIERLREMVTGQLMRVEIAERPPADLPHEEELPEMVPSHFDLFTGEDDMAQPEFDGGDSALAVKTRKPRRSVDPKNPATWGKVGRNDQCPCGSGKKYKHCHGAYA
jgi:preprotein translocase subunit SecA